MVSLDDAVLARLEKGGKRYEVLVDPVLVETFKETPNDVDINEFLAMDEVFHDASGEVSGPPPRRLRTSSARKTSSSSHPPFWKKAPFS